MTTPAQKAGLKVGDKITVIEPNHIFQRGDVLEFIRDDGDTAPIFKRESDGYEYYYSITRKWEKLNMKTKKQEALDQIAALQKFVEGLDTPSEDVVRVYIKKSTEGVSGRWIINKNMIGGVFDMKDSNPSGSTYTIWQDDEHSDYWMFNKCDCIVVEGSV